MTTELFIDKDVSKTDETLHDECIFKCRRCHTTRLILSPSLVTNQSVQAVNGCHQIIFFL
jgi:hypothetical protein